MFQDVPGCSGMFHVPGFVDALGEAKHTDITNKRVQREREPKIEALHKPGVCEAKYAQHKLDSQLAQAKHKRTNYKKNEGTVLPKMVLT